MEIEYNAELDEFFMTIPESMLQQLEWGEGDMLEYQLEDEVLRIFKI